MTDKRNLMEDAEDEGLKAVMGSKFQDVSQGGSKREMAAKATPQSRCSRDSSPYTGEPLVRSKGEGLEVPSYAPNWFDKLKGCGKYALGCGALVAVFWYWNMTGLMESTAAIPCMVVCGTYGGFKIGNVCRR